MADPIRPGFPGQAQQRQDTARSAAQRAFFAAAAGQPAPAAQASVPRPSIQTAQAEPQRTQKIPVNLPAEPPQKILRPGSLLDIKV